VTKIVGCFIIAALLFAAPGFAAPQRPYSSTYDTTRQVKLQGVVTRIDWVNPTAFVFVDVRDAAGTVSNWAVEIGSPIELERDGWKRSALHIGDAINVDAVAARGGARQASAKSIVLTKTNKRVFGPAAARRTAATPAPAPRWWSSSRRA